MDWPVLVNLRLDPFERSGLPRSDSGSLAYHNWFLNEFGRFGYAQKVVADAAQTLIDFPPTQRGGSFNMDAVKEQIQRAMASHSGE